MRKAARVVKAKVLIVVSKKDHMVNLYLAMDFPRLINARILELDNNCGHSRAVCQTGKVNKTVNKFFKQFTNR
jgi:homoserine acetyltransferase